MTAVDKAAMQQLLKDLVSAEDAVAKAETLARTLHLKNGQETIHCTVGGLHLDLTRLGPDYMPRMVQGRQELLELLRREAQNHLISCRSKVEGIQFRMRKASGARS